MRYYLKDGKEFVQNGKAIVEVHTLNIVPSQRTNKRVVRILAVKNIVKQSWSNPIAMDTKLGLSFPFERIGAKDYTWMVGEECQVDFKIEMLNADKIEGDIDDGNGPKLRDFSKQ